MSFSFQNFGTWPIYDMIFFRYMVCYGWLVHFCCAALSVWSCERSVANWFCFFFVFLLSLPIISASLSNMCTVAVVAWNPVHTFSSLLYCAMKDIGKPGRSRNRSGSGKNPPAWTEMEGCTAYRQPMTVFWSRAQHQHHVTTSLMKLTVSERNVATNLGIISRLSKNIIILVFKLPT